MLFLHLPAALNGPHCAIHITREWDDRIKAKTKLQQLHIANICTPLFITHCSGTAALSFHSH